MQMEPDEISVVLLRASELHTKISDAIERALKSEFLLTTTTAAAAASSGKRLSNVSSPNAAQEDDDDRAASARYFEEPEEANAEAKSLGGIRDALEALEEQLECLQGLQLQQRADRDTALAELEESRRILLKRIKNHHGKEWEVVREALAFAGEHVDDRDDLPLPPYPMPLDPAFNPQQQPSPLRITSQDDGGDHQSKQEQQQDGSVLFGIRLNFNLGRFAARFTSRAALVVAGVITIILFSEIGSRRNGSSASRPHKINQRSSMNNSPIISSASTANSTQKSPADHQERCPPGKVMILQDGVGKCVVKERIEIPFHGEVNSPDVLFGRG